MNGVRRSYKELKKHKKMKITKIELEINLVIFKIKITIER